MQFSISAQGIELGARPDSAISVDILFDDQRVWSIDLRTLEAPPHESTQLEWPPPLLPYLVGVSTVSLRDSATEQSFGSVEHRFTPGEDRVRVLDDRGNRLAINKWGRLGKTLDGVDDGFQTRIISRTVEVIEDLKDLGLRPFIVGGTLLGGVREGRLLPHDDDADLAYLSTKTNPADVAIEGFWVGRQLEKRGYRVVLHSATHMQLYFYTQDGAVDHYVDVFAAFLTDDGNVNQPFHVRGPMEESQLLPFSTVRIADIDFPAPADTDRWLTINYDDNWRTPIPGYRLGTPRATQRRFKNWFGSFHLHRDFWNEFHAANDPAQDRWLTGAAWIASRQDGSDSPTVIDLGTGDGRNLAELASRHPHRRFIGADYYHGSDASQRTLPPADNLEFAHLNLYRLRALGLFRRLAADSPVDLTLNHVLEQIGHEARLTSWRLIRMALSSGGTVAATVYTRPRKDVEFHDPTGWHLTTQQIRTSAAPFGVRCEFSKLAVAHPEDRGRAPVGIVFSLASEAIETRAERASMKQRIKQVLKRATTGPVSAELEALEQRIHLLESELDEYRRDSLRVAELVDLAERAFSAQTGQERIMTEPEAPAND